jgi:tetrahydromethanopterin S-methyltransferase subunit E
MSLIEKLMPWGPVFFGLLIFAPMWATVMGSVGVELPYGTPNIVLTLIIGLIWGTSAKIRGRWL